MTSLRIIRLLGCCSMLALMPLAPAKAQSRTVSEVFERGETSAWVFESAGKVIGHHVSRYDGLVELPGCNAHVFHGEVELEIPNPGGPLTQQLTGDLWTDEFGHCLRFVLHSRMVDVYSSVEIQLLSEPATANVRQGPGERMVPLSTAKDVFLLANSFIGHLELPLALNPLTPEEGSRKLPMLSGNVLQNFPLEVRYQGPYENQQEDAGEDGMVIEDSLGETLRVSNFGRIEELSIPAQKLVMRRTDKDFPGIHIEAPQPATSPAHDFELEPVTIEHGEVRLAGTISRKKGLEAHLPAVFFVSGSGGQDRNGMANGIDVGTHEILDRLTEEGYLVLRVDDRGVGESRGPTAGIGYVDLVADARACVQFLARRPDVVPKKICVIGHSEGGVTAPILAAEIEDVAAIVLLAAPGRSIHALMEEQFVYALLKQGESAETIASERALYRDFFTRATGDEPIDPASVREDLRAWLPVRRWMQEHSRIDLLANLRKVGCPVLVLQGARDIQVSAERDAKLLSEALDDAHHRDHQLMVFPELDHLFKKTTGPESTAEDYLRNRPVDARFLDALVGWMKARMS